jgi:hypothetical protein
MIRACRGARADRQQRQRLAPAGVADLADAADGAFFGEPRDRFLQLIDGREHDMVHDRLAHVRHDVGALFAHEGPSSVTLRAPLVGAREGSLLCFVWSRQAFVGVSPGYARNRQWSAPESTWM